MEREPRSCWHLHYLPPNKEVCAGNESIPSQFSTYLSTCIPSQTSSPYLVRATKGGDGMMNDVNSSQQTGDNKALPLTMLTSDGRLPSVSLSPEPFSSVWAQIVKCKSHIAAERRVVMHTSVGIWAIGCGSCHQTAVRKSIKFRHQLAFYNNFAI